MSRFTDRLRLPAFMLGIFLITTLPLFMLSAYFGTRPRLAAGDIVPVCAASAIIITITLTWMAARRSWATWRVLRRVYSVACILLAGDIAYGALVVFPFVRLSAQDAGITSPQIKAGLDQYFSENPDLIFARFDDIIGPRKFLPSCRSVDGEDYHEMFPLRVDARALTVTMRDGRKVIFFDNGHLRQTPDGKFPIARPEYVAAYQAWLASERKPDGVQVITLQGEKYFKQMSTGRRFEITYRNGSPEGAFRAYYANGQLWGEATYVHGVPVGPHRVYDEAGNLVLETTFP